MPITTYFLQFYQDIEYATSYSSLNIKIIDKVFFFFLLFKEIKQKHIYGQQIHRKLLFHYP